MPPSTPSEAAAPAPSTPLPVCGRLVLIDAALERLVLETREGRRFIVDGAALPPDVFTALEAGQSVIVLAATTSNPEWLVASDVKTQTWHPNAGIVAWQCFVGYVLAADKRRLTVRLSDGQTATVDRRGEAVVDVRNLHRGDRVTVAGPVTGVRPASVIARYIMLDRPGTPWPRQ